MMVISVGILSGCTDTTNETTDNGDTDEDSNGDSVEVELVNYTIVTFGSDYGYKPEYIGDGFVHNEQALNGYYKITGTIKNIAGRTLDNITIKVDFYNKNHTYLDSEFSELKNIFDLPLPDTETADFKILYIGLYHESYFEDVEEVEFNISAV